MFVVQPAAIRNAMAMTAFTVACGSLAPAIAAMSEPHVTERGVLALVDYPGTLVLLPTMFWGLSMGESLTLATPLSYQQAPFGGA